MWGSHWFLVRWGSVLGIDLGTAPAHWLIVGLRDAELGGCRVDRSTDAVTLAELNRQRLQIDNATILQSDWFSALSGGADEQVRSFEMIVSNPPYIDPQDPHLQQGDVRFEPVSALLADNHGLADIQHIAEHSCQHLAANGWLLIEHGYDQGPAVREIFTRAGFVQVRTEQDYGGNDRVTLGCLPSIEWGNCLPKHGSG